MTTPVRQEIEDAAEMRDLLLAIGREGRSGLFAASGDHDCILKVRDGRLVHADGEEPSERLARALAAAGVLPEKALDRVLSVARTGRQGLYRILEDLALLGDDDIPRYERIRLETMFRLAVGGTGPWRWSESPQKGSGGESILNLLAHALAIQMEPRDLIAWAGRPDDLVFHPPTDEVWGRIEAGARETIAALDGRRALREILAGSRLSGRHALVWLALASRLGWIGPAADAPAAAAVTAAPTPSDDHDDSGLMVLDELDAIEEYEDLEILEDIEPVAEDSAADAPVVDPGAPVVADVEAEATSEFWQEAPPADLYARLDVPSGAAGQGLAQAYSRRFRILQKLEAERPNDPRVETWRKAVLDAYRVLGHADARTLYEADTGKGDPAARVTREMAKRTLAEGIRQIRSGHPWEGARAVQEALNWNDSLAEAWVALGFVQASRDDDHEEIEAAAESFDKAAQLAPDNAVLRYYRAVANWHLGRKDAFAADAAWLNERRDRAPAAWPQFLAEIGAAA